MPNNNYNNSNELKSLKCPVFINMKLNKKMKSQLKKRIYKPEHNNPSRPYEQSGGHPNRKP